MGTAGQTDHVAVKAAAERPAVFPDLQPPAGRREAVAGCHDIPHATPACDGTYYENAHDEDGRESDAYR